MPMIIIYNHGHMMIHLSFAGGFGCNIGCKDSIVRKLHLMMVDRTKMQFTYLQLFFSLTIYLYFKLSQNKFVSKFFILKKEIWVDKNHGKGNKISNNHE